MKIRNKFIWKPRLNANLLQALYISCLVLIEIRYKSGPVSLRMATANSDDNAIVSTMVQNNSSLYTQDFYARLVTIIQSNSAISWIVNIQHELLNITFEHIWLEIFALQRVLLYISIFALTKLVTENKITPFFVVLAVSATNPYYWNLGWFGALDDQPYPMWLAIPFFILAFVSLNKSDKKIAYGHYLLGFLIHPSFGILIGIFLVLDDIIKNLSDSNLTHKLKTYVSVSIIPVLYVLISKILEPKQIAFPEDLKAIAFTNQHLDFFNLFTTDFKLLSIRVWVLTLCLYILSKQHLKNVKKKNYIKQQQLMLMCLLAFVILHWLALELEFVPGIILFGPRFSVFFILICFVYFSVFLIEGFSKVNTVQKFTYFLTMLMPSVGILLIFTLFEVIKNKWANCRKELDVLQALGIILVVVVSVAGKVLAFVSPSLALEYDQSWVNNSFLNAKNTGFSSYLLLAFGTNPILFTGLLVLVFCVFFFELASHKIMQLRIRIKRQTRKVQIILLLFLTGTLAMGLKYQYPLTFSLVPLVEVEDYADVQNWARGNTAVGSYFFFEGAAPFYSWRTYSQRPAVHPDMVFSLYNYPKFIAERNLEWEKWWESSLKSGKSNLVGERSTNFFCLSREFLNTEYIVRSFKQEKLNFPIVYSNSHYLIYKAACDD